MKLAPKHPVARFQRLFSRITPESDLNLEALYHDDVRFIDPFHQFSRRKDLQDYFDRLTRRLMWAEFDFEPAVVDAGAAALPWTMRFRGKRFPREMAVEGISHFRFDDRITYHRDHFDVSAMMADAIPGGSSFWRRLKSLA